MSATATKGVLGVEKNPAIQRRLLHYLQGGRVHQAILLTGPETQTKFEIAKGMAKFLLCPEKKESFCNQCSTCKRIDKEIHPDVLILREAGEDHIKIETIREASHQMAVLPMEGSRKICILDECHRMNPASSNAFLKTLEEPGEGRYFLLLTTQPGSLLPTILSRVVQFHFKPDTEVPAVDEGETTEFSDLFQKFVQSGNPIPVTQALVEKDRTLRFLRFLQTQLRLATLGEKTSLPLEKLSEPELIKKFNAALELEGRLRSNASYGLMLEDLLRQNFGRTP